MDYARVTPRARSGTAGISVEYDIESGQGCWINPPERIAAVTVAVHIPSGATASFKIQACCNTVDTIGQNGEGGYWDDINSLAPTYTASQVFTLINAVTGIRVICNSITKGKKLNVCFVG